MNNKSLKKISSSLFAVGLIAVAISLISGALFGLLSCSEIERVLTVLSRKENTSRRYATMGYLQDVYHSGEYTYSQY